VDSVTSQFSLVNSAVNVTLPAFAAVRRAAGAVAAERRRCRSICPGREALRSKTAAAVVRQWDRQTDGRTDARPLHRPCSTYYAGSVSNAVHIISNNRA